MKMKKSNFKSVIWRKITYNEKNKGSDDFKKYCLFFGTL